MLRTSSVPAPLILYLEAEFIQSWYKYGIIYDNNAISTIRYAS